MLETLVKQLCQELGIDEKSATSSEVGHFHFLFNGASGEIEVELSPSIQGGYLVKGTLGPNPKQNNEAFFVKALEANLFGKGTRGSVIGLNKDANILTLSLEIDYNSNYREFKEKLEDFVTALDYWREDALKHR